MSTPFLRESPRGRRYTRSRCSFGEALPIFACLLLGLPARATGDLHTSEQDLLHGRADQAISALRLTVGRDPGDAAAHLLLCRVFLSEGHGTEAAEQCQAALNTGLQQDAEAQDWAGRAFGRKAEHAGPLAGLKLAGEVRTAFLTAYKLNPRSSAAANDLGEFYIDAPLLVGGGVGKAAALADALQPTLPATAHRLRGLIAEKRGDTLAAEQEFLAAVEVAHAPGTLADLSSFYVRQKSWEKATAAARRALAQDRGLDANVVDVATSLSDAHQTAQAIGILRGYLERGHQSDQAPAFRVRTMLGEILARAGDRDGARREFQQALALASGYAPAQKGLASLE